MLIFLEWSAAFITWFLVRVQPYWRKIEPFLRLVILLIVTLIVTFWVAVFCYLLLYYLYVPIARADKPLNLKFSSSCKQLGEYTGVACSFPKDNISIKENGRAILSFGQSYKLFITLEVPESDINRKIGMFMIGVKMIDKDSEVIEETQRPTMLEYKSSLLETIETFIFVPMYIMGSRRQRQSLRVEMFSSLIDNPYTNIESVEVTIYTQLLQYYSGSIQLYANFSGIRSFMFYYPILSSFCFVTVFFLSLNFLVLINWLHRQWVKLESQQPMQHQHHQTITPVAPQESDEDSNDSNPDSIENKHDESDEDSWPEPRPSSISGQKIIHRKKKNSDINYVENIGSVNSNS